MSPSEGEGREFESRQAHQNKKFQQNGDFLFCVLFGVARTHEVRSVSETNDAKGGPNEMRMRACPEQTNQAHQNKKRFNADGFPQQVRE